MSTLNENIAIPIHLDAYALSPDCCNGPSKLAPYTQPNYVALQLNNNTIQHDILEHVDFHLASTASKNRRLTDVGSKSASIKTQRLGVHLHWTIPRFYRTATSTAQRSQAPQPDGQTSTADKSQPTFPLIPNRWLIIRNLQRCEPAGALPTFQGWLIESDVVRKVTDDNVPKDLDLESDATPFVSYTGKPSDPATLKNQCEVILGQKFNWNDWKEEPKLRNHMRLSVMNSSNPLFPDYALHNTNVLSMIDNFQFQKPAGGTDFCTTALAHYYVLGWHDSGSDDPFSKIPDTLGQKLSSLMLKVDTTDANVSKHTALSGSVRCMNHGAIYNVPYNRNGKPPSLADEAATKFTKSDDMEPLAVGTTTLDAMLTFLKAHRKNENDFFNMEHATDIANDLIQISSLLYATADEYDARVQALDLIAQQNYSKADGGGYWTFSEQTTPGQSPSVPSKTVSEDLRNLNAMQMTLDACERKLPSSQWNLFAEWWKWVSRSFSDARAKDAAAPDLRKRVDQLKSDCKALQTLIKSLRDSINSKSQTMAVKKSSRRYFNQRLDPTLCVAGIDPGRPKDFMDPLQVREDHQLQQDTSKVDDIFRDKDKKQINFPLPTDNKLDQTARRLLAECLSKSNTTEMLTTTSGFRTWGSHNPFVPLFIEWEGTYYHIDNDQHNAWDVDFRPSPVAPLNSQLRYEPTQILSSDPKNRSDTRAVSGRILVLPQPSFSLEATVKQLLGGNSPDMDLTDAQVKDVLLNIRNMQFISAPLSGLTNHLLTRCEGAHVKPNVRDQGQTAIPLSAAVEAASAIRIDRDALLLIDSETALTPYGTLTDFANTNYPFKPVTQGQMIFTKINIIDKFGQAICVPTPKPRRRKPLPDVSSKIYPCLSDYLTPDVRNGKLNTVVDLPGSQIGAGNPGDPKGSGSFPLCQFIQLTPSINQDARINASFVVRDDDSTRLCPWRAATDYEQPIWGWIVINYADYGLQFFLSSGEFYQEIRMGGVNGTATGPKYIPFTQPNANVIKSSAANAQLDGLIALFKQDPDYLQAFFDMINGGIATMPFPPGDYGGFANAIVGKPLALVNVGYSLELAAPPIVAQNTLGKSKAREPPYDGHPEDPEPAFQDDIQKYSFPIKIGDQQRTYDGVIGYFDTSNDTKDNGATSWDTLFTYFSPDKAHPKFKPIDKTTFPIVKPYYHHPERSPPNMIPMKAAKEWQIKSILVDPYTPLHIYSPILPSVPLQLPAWTVQTALKRMSAFFRLGPVLLTRDIPASAFLPSASTSVAPPLSPPPPPPPPPPPSNGTSSTDPLPPIPPLPINPAIVPPTEPPTLRLPIAGRKGTWTWLQPYDVPGSSEKDAPVYGTWNVENDHGGVKFVEAPYTFVEGFLKLAGDLE